MSMFLWLFWCIGSGWLVGDICATLKCKPMRFLLIALLAGAFNAGLGQLLFDGPLNQKAKISEVER